VEKAARDILKIPHINIGPADPYVGSPQATATMISGGTIHNVIPDRCKFTIDVRTVPGPTHKEVVERLARVLESELTPHSDRYRPCSTDENESIVRCARSVMPDSPLVGSPTASDWVFIDAPAIKIGPGDSTLSHRPDEYANVETVRRSADIFAEMARRFLGGES
jgi:acetylornithine deacetylase